MKKIFLYIVLTFLSGVLIYSYWSYTNLNSNKKDKIVKSINNFYKVKDFLEKYYDGKYPIPEWDLVLLDKNLELIHLEDRSKNLNQIKDLYVIQWTTCNILKDSKEFNKINYDSRFSLVSEDWDIFNKRCFSYSVTKDQKDYQIWTILKEGWVYETILEWRFKDKSIIKSYDSSVLVQKESNNFLPYPWEHLSPILQVKDVSNTDLEVKVVPKNWKDYNLDLKDWNNVLFSWNDMSYDIEIIWKLKNNNNLKLVNTNGNVIYINWDKNWNVDFKIENFWLNSNNIDYFVETWRFIANIVKLEDKKNINVKKDWVTLVVRWTKFWVSSIDKEFHTYLSIWSLINKIWNQRYEMSLDGRSFTNIVKNRLVDDINKSNELLVYSIWNDIKINKYNLRHKLRDFKDLDANFTSVSFTGTDRFEFTYENEEILWAVKFKNDWTFIDKITNQIEFENEPIKKSKIYSGIVNKYCLNSNLNNWLDTSKFSYLFENIWWDDLFELKDEIEEGLSVDGDYIVFSSRTYNNQDSIRFGYNSKNKRIETYNFNNLKYQDIDNIIFLCDK